MMDTQKEEEIIDLTGHEPQPKNKKRKHYFESIYYTEEKPEVDEKSPPTKKSKSSQDLQTPGCDSDDELLNRAFIPISEHSARYGHNSLASHTHNTGFSSGQYRHGEIVNGAIFAVDPGEVNLAFCILDGNPAFEDPLTGFLFSKIVKWGRLGLQQFWEGLNQQTQDYDQTQALLYWLNDLGVLKSDIKVRIENQHCRLSNVFSISVGIQCIFKTFYFLNGYDGGDVELFPSRYKEVFIETYERSHNLNFSEHSNADPTKKYYRKKRSEFVGTHIINSYPEIYGEWSEFLRQERKKDDICDALFTALCVMNKDKLVRTNASKKRKRT